MPDWYWIVLLKALLGFLCLLPVGFVQAVFRPANKPRIFLEEFIWAWLSAFAAFWPFFYL